jgi:peptidoglycan/LPS O-acetylase OafA/YrhL
VQNSFLAGGHALKYRSDIDGLRAIAVLSVIFFHLGFTSIPGGFVGVDIFFVTSGYLISTIIFKEIADGTFSISKFYVRRARRILPALFMVVIVTAGFALKYLYPAELVAFGNSAAASALFFANIHFYSTLNYFSPNADELPLLHLWSLGVEEQFYFVFPLAALAVAKWKPRLMPVLIGSGLVVSLVLSVVALKTDPSAAFYLLPFRAFELLVGSVLALPKLPSIRRVPVANGMAVLGLVSIVLSLVMYSNDTAFPGIAALLPCISAALLIHSGAAVTTVAGRVLGSIALRSIGKVSYSLYLIHWPIIVFGKRLFPAASPGQFALGALACTFILALLNYRLVEQFFRHERVWLKTVHVFGITSVSIGMVVGAAGFTASHVGFAASIDARAAQALSYLQYDPKVPFRSRRCFLDPDQNPSTVDFSGCMPQGTGKKVMLWGDSHAAHFYDGFEATLRGRGYALGSITASACAPILGYDVAARPFCRAFNDLAFPIIMRERPDFVILSANWPQDQASLDSMERTVNKLLAEKIRVVILGETPLYKQSVPKIIADRIIAKNQDMQANAELELGFLRVSDQLLTQRFNDKDGVTYVPVFQLLCPRERCPLIASDDVPVQFDTAHLTTSGSHMFAKTLTPWLFKTNGH